MAEIARGEIDIGLNDHATPELRRIEAEYQAAMSRIDRMEAAAKITARTEELDRKIAEAKDKVRQLEGERAKVEIGADTKELDAKLAEARRAVKRLDGEKATIQIDTRGEEKALAAIEAVKRAEAARAAAEERYARQRQRVADQEDKNRRLSERAAYRQGEIARKAELDGAKQEQRIAALRHRYAQLTDEIEKVDKEAKSFHGRESQIKLEVNRQHLVASLEAAKAELNFLGGHPPVHVKVDTDKSDVGRLRNWMNSLKGAITGIAEKASSIGHVRLNLGPFSGTIRTMTLAVAGLSPILTSLAGSATALIGVLGTGLAGAAAVAGGTIAGLAMNFGGVATAVKPAISDFKLAEQATTNYHKAVDKYGASSKQAKTAQEQMNSVLKSVDPNARQAAKGFANISSEWRKLTGGSARKAVGDILTGGVKTLNALMPTLARNTNETLGILDTKLTGIEGKLRSPGAVRIFDSLGKSANTFLGPAMDGLTHLGAAFGHIGESAARLFAGPAGQGFNKFASSIDKATQPGAKLDATISRLGHHAADLLHFFGALGRLLMTVFNGGADSGDRLVRSMTNALNRWNKFLQGPKGQQDMERFFNRSEANVRALWGALAPLVGAFVQWSNLLAPFTTGILKGITFISKLVGGLTSLIGLGGPLTALGATMGAVFAVSKLGSFLNMLVRIAATMKELGALGTLKSIATGNFRSAMGSITGGGGAAAEMRVAMAEGGAAAAGEIRAAFAEGGAVAAGEERAAMAEGGAAAAGESAIGGAAGGAGAGLLGGSLAALTGGEAAAGAATTVFGGELAALAVAAAPVTAIVLGVGAAAYGLSKIFESGKPKMQGWVEELAHGANQASSGHQAFGRLQGSIADVGSSYAHTRLNLKQATEELKNTKKGTTEHQAALLDYRDALKANITARDQFTKQAKGLQTSANTELIGLRKTRDLMEKSGASGKELAGVNAAIERAQNKSAAATDVAARAYRDMIPLTDSATQAVGKLARQAGGGPIAKKISLKFEAPQDVQAVANKATSAIRSGVPSKQVMRIVADSSNAEQAIRRLNGLQLQRKRLQIEAADNASNAIRHIAAQLFGLPDKHNTNVNAKDNASGPAGAVRRAIGAIPGAHNTNVSAKDNASGPAHGAKGALNSIPGFVSSVIRAVDHASGVAQAVSSALSAIHDVTFTIFGKHAGATHAQGGTETPETKAAQRVVHRAQARGPQRTTGGQYNQPTFLVGEEDRTEYVIATNPAYRRSNIGYLAAAANDLGYNVVPAKKGRRPKKHPAAHHGNPPADTAPGSSASNRGSLGVPDPYSVGALPVDDVQNDVTKIDDALKTQRELSVRLGTQIRGVHIPRATHDKHGHVTNAKAINTAKRRLADLKAHKLAADQGGQWRNINYLSLKELKKRDDQANTDLNTLKKFNADLNDLNGRISRDRSRMENDSKRFDATGDPKYHDDWITARNDRGDGINDLKRRLAKALSAAQTIQSLWPTINQQGLVNDLTNQVSDATDAQTDNDLADEPGTSAADAGPPTLESFIKSQGWTDKLAGLNMAVALSQINDVQDNPATPYVDEHAASLADNVAAAANLRDFYSGVLSQAQLSNQPADVITDAANTFVQARDEYQSLADTINAGAAQAAQNKVNDVINYSAAREDLYTQFGSNYAPVSNPLSPTPGYALSPAPSPGAFGSNLSGDTTTQTVNINNTFPTPPPDPHTWSQGVAWELQAAM